MNSLEEEFENFRQSILDDPRYLQIERSMKVNIGKCFQSRAIKLFEARHYLEITDYKVLLHALDILHITDDYFENFFKLSKFHRSVITKRSYDPSMPGIALLLNLTDSIRIEPVEYDLDNLELLLHALETCESFVTNPHYSSVDEHRDISLSFQNIVKYFLNFTDEEGGTVYGDFFATTAYIMRNLFGEDRTLDALKRFKQENFAPDSETLVKIVAVYDDFKDHPLDWIEQMAKGFTLDDLNSRLSVDRSDDQKL